MVPMFSPLCLCASSQRTRPGSNVTSATLARFANYRRSKPLNVTMTLSGRSCGLVRWPVARPTVCSFRRLPGRA